MKDFNSKCKILENKISKLDKLTFDIFPIIDGVINQEEYLKAKYKILWILKEPYNDNGGWNLCESINKMKSWKEQPKSGRNTYEPMILSSYSILNNFLPYEKIPSILDTNVFNTFKKIAYINIKKHPNIKCSISNDKEIKKAYIENKNILLEQINTYNPDIVIGGNTLHYFFDDLQIPKKQSILTGTFKRPHYLTKDRLYIGAYHPSVRKKDCSRNDYCNHIITVSKNWSESKTTI